MALVAAWIFSANSSLPSGPLKFRVESVWGIQGAQPGELQFPRVIEPAADGSLFIIDRSGRIQHFTRDGHLLKSWSLPEWQKGTPTGMTLDRSGNLVVANCHYSTILVYSPKGELLRQFGEGGDGPGQLLFATDVAVDDDGFYYVTNYGERGDKIVKFNPQGGFVKEWGSCGEGPGQLQRAMSLVLDLQGRLWVADSGNDRLQVFDREGNHLMSVGSSGGGEGQFRYPYDLAIGPRASVVVIEYGNNRLQVLSAEGQCLGLTGGPGHEPGQFAQPWGVNCDPQGTIWVTDTLNNRIQQIRAVGLKGWGAGS